jgi:hypothetical protein
MADRVNPQKNGPDGKIVAPKTSDIPKAMGAPIGPKIAPKSVCVKKLIEILRNCVLIASGPVKITSKPISIEEIAIILVVNILFKSVPFPL